MNWQMILGGASILVSPSLGMATLSSSFFLTVFFFGLILLNIGIYKSVEVKNEK
jgi:hypothetical protein